jgi:hypothetical protein
MRFYIKPLHNENSKKGPKNTMVFETTFELLTLF